MLMNAASICTRDEPMDEHFVVHVLCDRLLPVAEKILNLLLAIATNISNQPILDNLSNVIGEEIDSMTTMDNAPIHKGAKMGFPNHLRSCHTAQCSMP